MKLKDSPHSELLGPISDCEHPLNHADLGLLCHMQVAQEDSTPGVR